jgi:hypothetical protein
LDGEFICPTDATRAGLRRVGRFVEAGGSSDGAAIVESSSQSKELAG